MSAADQQSLNAVKAALQNARTRDAAGSTFAAPGEQPFVCATVGLRINDLQAVVRLADDLSTVQTQRDELLEGVEKLVDGLTEETRKRNVAEVALAEVMTERDEASRLCLEGARRLAPLRAEVERLKREAATVAKFVALAREATERLARLAEGKEGRKPQVALGWIRECVKDIRAPLNAAVTSEPAPVEPKPHCERDPKCVWPAGHVGDAHCHTVSATAPDEPVKCATFSPSTIPADVRARMDADRQAAESSITVIEMRQKLERFREGLDDAGLLDKYIRADETVADEIAELDFALTQVKP